MTAGAEIRVTASPGEIRVAGLHQGVLQLAVVERPTQPDGVGDLHLARVSALAPAMSGAFLSLANGLTGFLPEGELPAPRRPIAQAIQEGQAIAVRIARAAQGGKGPRLSARLAPEDLAASAPASASAAATGPRLLRRGPDAATRLATAWPGAAIMTDSAEVAARMRARFGPERVAMRLDPAFDADLEASFAELGSARVELPGGASLLIQPTSALTAIDVDAGSAAGSRDAGTHLRINRAAAEEVARQIRLRNLAGAILVDFAGLSVRQREALVDPLAQALLADPLKPRLLGLSRLGLMEITRARVHPPLHEVLGLPPSPLTRGLALLRRATREAAARPGARLVLQAAPEIVAALEAMAPALEEFRRMTGRPLGLEADRLLQPGDERIVEGEGR